MALASLGGTDFNVMPADFVSNPLLISADRGAAGRFPEDGCFGVEVSLRADGRASNANIINSTKIYSLDRDLLRALTQYRFSIPDSFTEFDARWRVFIAYDKKGKDFQFVGACPRAPHE